MYLACMYPFLRRVLICFCLVIHRRVLYAYSGVKLPTFVSISMLYIPQFCFLLFFCQGIGVWVSFICSPPAAPSLAAWSAILGIYFCFELLTNKGSQSGVYRVFKPSYDIINRWCQGLLFRQQVPCTPAYAAKLLTLHQHRANNQYRTANQI